VTNQTSSLSHSNSSVFSASRAHTLEATQCVSSTFTRIVPTFYVLVFTGNIPTNNKLPVTNTNSNWRTFQEQWFPGCGSILSIKIYRLFILPSSSHIATEAAYSPKTPHIKASVWWLESKLRVGLSISLLKGLPICIVFPTSYSSARQLSQNVPTKEIFLCDKAAVLGETSKKEFKY
jgi:hypothetical protein